MKYIKLIIPFLTIFIFLITCRPAVAQQVVPSIASINVDNLSDAQVRKIMAQAESAGISDSDLIQSLESKGMSTDQAERLRTRISDIRNGVSGKKHTTLASADSSNAQKSRKLNYKPDSLDNPLAQPDFVSSLIPKVFGADLFSNRNTTFEPNLKLATPVNYVLGPDDHVLININGSSVVSWDLLVSADGNINIPNVGLVNVGGKTIEKAKQDIKSRLVANNYPIDHGASLNISLGDIRSIKVILVGEVKRPGTYTLPSVATVFNALYSSGGPTDNGSFRNIEVIRGGKVIRRLDIYAFLLNGDQKNNILLQDQDIIRVPSYDVRVELDGEVKNPALFEVLPGETLQDVLKFAGGFTNIAYTARIKAIQISDQQHRITDVFAKDFGTYHPKRGDSYVVERIINRYENRVNITGAVFRPGDYELKPGMTLSQLIGDAAGLKEDAFMQRGTIKRLNPDNSTASISFNLGGIMNKSIADIPLQREDSVKITSIFDLRDKYTVTIKGQVRNPGEFAYADSMTVEDLIINSGGFSIGASTKRIEVARRVSNSDPSSKNSILSQVFSVNVDADLKEQDIDFKLKPYDIVSVYTLPGYEKQSNVKVEGEVLYPGNYTIQRKNERISDIIARAGGLTASADVEGGSLKRDNTLGINKQKIDSAELAQLKADSINRVKFRDTTGVQLRNNYVGINLKKILANPGEGDDLILEDGDVLRIPKQQQVVRVNGEVLYPSAVVYRENESLKNYVLKAGGFSPGADIRRAYVVYPNGTVAGTRKFLFFNSYPRIKAGSEINVPKKPYKRPVSAAEIVGITSSIASLALVVLYIIQNSK